MTDPDAAARERLEREPNVWFASVRPDGRPHLVPIWFVWMDGRFFACIQPGSVKAGNVRREARVTVSLEDGSRPVICEGRARFVAPPWPPTVVEAFRGKYDWDLAVEVDYTATVEIVPQKWLTWGSSIPSSSAGGV